jgi:hypothetical protein
LNAEVGRRLCELLIVWGYAEPDMSGEDRDHAADKNRPD